MMVILTMVAFVYHSAELRSAAERAARLQDEIDRLTAAAEDKAVFDQLVRWSLNLRCAGFSWSARTGDALANAVRQSGCHERCGTAVGEALAAHWTKIDALA